MSKTALLIMAQGSEELESIAVWNVLRRGKIDITIGAVGNDKMITCSQGSRIEAHGLLSEYKDKLFDAIIVPGGIPGAKAISADSLAAELLKKHAQNEKLVAAICASPSFVLKPLGLLENTKNTGYPAELFKLDNPEDNTVVIDGRLITSRGPATAILFGLAILEFLTDTKAAKEVGAGMLVDVETEFSNFLYA